MWNCFALKYLVSNVRYSTALCRSSFKNLFPMQKKPMPYLTPSAVGTLYRFLLIKKYKSNQISFSHNFVLARRIKSQCNTLKSFDECERFKVCKYFFYRYHTHCPEHKLWEVNLLYLSVMIQHLSVGHTPHTKKRKQVH